MAYLLNGPSLHQSMQWLVDFEPYGIIIQLKNWSKYGTRGVMRIADHDCALCPRLVSYRNQNRAAFPDWHNGPVQSFGSLRSELLILGLAPGVRGANKTGRPFTGDFAGDLLYETLSAYRFSVGKYGSSLNDGVELINCRIANAVRCVPPQNKPVGAEIRSCALFLEEEIAAMKNLKLILALGTIAHNSALNVFGHRKALFKFGHNQLHEFGQGPDILNSYHCSRYNTNTGRLTPQMFHDVFDRIRTIIPQT